MAILGLQGIRGGVGTTSITAALARALQLLGETVLVVDASPDNMPRFFNVDFDHHNGWARSLIDGRDWRDAGLRYTAHIDLLPFGRLTPGEREHVDKLSPTWNPSQRKSNCSISRGATAGCCLIFRRATLRLPANC